MPDGHRQRDPHVSVAERVAGRPGRGIVMGPGPFDLRSVAFGGRIVDHQQHARKFVQRLLVDQRQHPRSQVEPPPPDTLEKVVETPKVVGDAGRAQPAGDRAASAGEQHAQHQRRQPPPRLAV